MLSSTEEEEERLLEVEEARQSIIDRLRANAAVVPQLRAALIEIANLDYANAATNLSAYTAVSIARKALLATGSVGDIGDKK